MWFPTVLRVRVVRGFAVFARCKSVSVFYRPLDATRGSMAS